ncbi:hypothetical protein LTR56_008453 [Elasticomyces elasticus]|nr:hypothetical protein LTR22_023380 [Elasticomyces elasticus]KAK3646689.1 hypothetical protein LTR56_008453 [Elasticomyces elasticus]
MTRLYILRMTWQVADVVSDAAIESSSALVAAVEHSIPGLHDWLPIRTVVTQMTLRLVTTIGADIARASALRSHRTSLRDKELRVGARRKA